MKIFNPQVVARENSASSWTTWLKQESMLNKAAFRLLLLWEF